MLSKIAAKFRRILFAAMIGKDYIKQKPDGTLYVDGVELDRDDLNAMNSWQDLVDLGVPRATVGKIALDYGGHPRNVDIWLENNSTPFKKDPLEEYEDSIEEQYIKTFSEDLEDDYQEAINNMKPVNIHKKHGMSEELTVPGYEKVKYYVYVEDKPWYWPVREKERCVEAIVWREGDRHHSERIMGGCWLQVRGLAHSRAAKKPIDWEKFAKDVLDKCDELEPY